MDKAKRIPYGIADYGRLRRDNMYYVDKTAFIPLIEAAPYYLFLIRPRRFGKSLWLSTLEHYYDVNQADDFDALFGDTYIGQQPTAERNSYLILSFNFSKVSSDLAKVETSFNAHIENRMFFFGKRYRELLDAEYFEVLSRYSEAYQKLEFILDYAGACGLKVYVLIDEYDNFANTILTTAGQQAYHDLTHGAGYLRFFFNILKGATSGAMGGLTRMFITGVSPVTMDDVTSGFNIGTNISLYRRFNALLGFREGEVNAMLTYYHAAGVLTLDKEACRETMSAWYAGYRFAEEAPEHLYNADMVFYFLQNAQQRVSLPKRLVDDNIRIDYGKLRHLMLVNRRLNGNFSLLQRIVEEGSTKGRIVSSFPLERLLRRENFVSLLFYFGLLTFDGAEEGEPILRIPNLTVKALMYGYIREGLDDVDVFRVDVYTFSRLMRKMAYRGEWQPVFDFLAAAVQQQTSVRDYLAGEKVLQGFLLAYLNVTNFHLTWSERELGGGFGDIYLEPFLGRYPDMKYGYLIELKYIARGEFTPARLTAAVAQAESQLRRYAGDVRLTDMRDRVALKSLVLVYNGWELVYREEVKFAEPGD